MRVALVLVAATLLSACAHREAFQVASNYKINDWEASCWGGKANACLMFKRVTGVGNFRVEWQADAVTLSELTCRSEGEWKDTELNRRGKLDDAATAIHSRLEDAVRACNREAMAVVDGTLEVAILLARATD